MLGPIRVLGLAAKQALMVEFKVGGKWIRSDVRQLRHYL